MRLAIVGMEAERAQELLAQVADLAEDGGIAPDWQQLEAIVTASRPDVVAIHLGVRPGQTLAMVRRVRSMYPAAAFLALVEEELPGIVQAAGDAGCLDLVLLSQLPTDLRRALRVVNQRGGPDRVEGELFTVIGAKGGVGTTTVAANLAAELASRGGRRVVLVDLHLYMGDLAVVLDMRPSPTALWFMHQAARVDPKTWLEAPPQHRAGFRLVGLDGRMAEADPVTAEQAVFLLERLRERYEYVVVDAGSEINEVSLAACSVGRHRILVLTDDLAARTGAMRRVQALHALDDSTPTPSRLVLNRDSGVQGRDLQMLEEFVGGQVFGRITNSWAEVQAALERGQVLRAASPKAQITQDFARLVDALIGSGQDQEKRKRTFFNFFR